MELCLISNTFWEIQFFQQLVICHLKDKLMYFQNYLKIGGESMRA